MSRAAVLLHRQRFPEDLQQLLAWYKVRDTLLGENSAKQDIKKALELASVCEYPNAVRLTKLFAGRDVACREEARRVFLGCENDPRTLCFTGVLGGTVDEICRAAGLGDAFALAGMAWETVVKSVFNGLKNLLLRENVMVSTGLDIATYIEMGARKTRKEQERIFWLLMQRSFLQSDEL
jgi:hypothetical protein